jgi:type II secretory pathway pseudopilin PulG
MKRPSKQTERWAMGILGVVCLALVVFLSKRIFSGNVAQVSAAQTASAQGSQAMGRRTGGAKPAVGDDLARYNPELKLDLLEQIETHPLPASSRNPFEYPPPPPKPIDVSKTTPLPPPPPPTLPLKAIGYSVKAGNVPEAVLTDDQDLYVVHVGDTFAKRYRVLSLTPNKIEIQDATTQQTVQLPIAQ